MRHLTAALMLALLALGGRAASAGAVAPGEQLAPHRAVYALTLGALRSSAAVVQAAGRFEFEWSDVCDGWTVNQRFRLALIYEDDLSVSYGWSLSSWESKDGKRYRFFIRRFDGSGQSASVRGSAEIGADGSGRALYSLPEEHEVPLPAGTLFPTGHTLRVLQEAAAGRTSVWTHVFDGSGDEGLFGVSAALTRALAKGTPAQIASPLLDEVPSWRVNLAFFGPQADDPEPQQEQAVRLFANGVVDEMHLDYGEFVLDANLTELVPLPRPSC